MLMIIITLVVAVSIAIGAEKFQITPWRGPVSPPAVHCFGTTSPVAAPRYGP